MHRVPTLSVMVLLFLTTLAAAQVTIDIKPGDGNNPIQTKAKGNAQTPVAILCSATFDPVALVDDASLRLGTGAAPAIKCVENDVNQDGCVDLKCGFRTRLLGVTCANTSLTLTGMLTDDTAFTATNLIKPVPCPGKLSDDEEDE
jgi:hypothetical protein